MAPTTNTAGAITSIVGIKNNTHPQWWRDSGLRKLNFCIALYVNDYTGADERQETDALLIKASTCPAPWEATTVLCVSMLTPECGG